MKIGLLDVDGHHFPNLPLMKISAYHKAQGDSVDLYTLKSYLPLLKHDKVYVSKVFDFTPDYQYPINADEIIHGGTGYSMTAMLPMEIENMYPDYNLYDHSVDVNKMVRNTAYGFLTRGCPRQCDFCIVSEKEGCTSRKVADLDSFWHGQKEIKLLDPNLLASRERVELLQQLIDSRALIDFTQGLDIRLMTEEIAELIQRCNVKMLHFAWDKEKDSEVICRKLKEFKELTGIDRRKAAVYILTNFDTEFEFDLYRIYELRNLGYDPYVMIYNKHKAEQKYKDLQRWINGKVFLSVPSFEDYKPRQDRRAI